MSLAERQQGELLSSAMSCGRELCHRVKSPTCGVETELVHVSCIVSCICFKHSALSCAWSVHAAAKMHGSRVIFALLYRRPLGDGSGIPT